MTTSVESWDSVNLGNLFMPEARRKRAGHQESRRGGQALDTLR